jgi:hypothetical protein
MPSRTACSAALSVPKRRPMNRRDPGAEPGDLRCKRPTARHHPSRGQRPGYSVPKKSVKGQGPAPSLMSQAAVPQSRRHPCHFQQQGSLPCLGASVRPGLHAYLATVARNAGCDCHRVGGVADHVPLAIRLSRTITIAQLVETLKTSSSKWVKTQTKELGGFSWQRGYGCFSVGPSDLESP